MLWSRPGDLDREPGVGYEPNHFVPLFTKQEEKTEKVSQSKMNFQKLSESSPNVDGATAATAPGAAEKQSPICDNDLKGTRQEGKSRDGKNDLEDEQKGKGFPYDIGTFYNKVGKLSDKDKYDILTNLWTPSQDFPFPIRILSGKNRKFNFQWIQKFPSLTYSKILDGALCIVFLVFCFEVKVF